MQELVDVGHSLWQLLPRWKQKPVQRLKQLAIIFIFDQLKRRDRDNEYSPGLQCDADEAWPGLGMCRLRVKAVRLAAARLLPRCVHTWPTASFVGLTPTWVQQHAPSNLKFMHARCRAALVWVRQHGALLVSLLYIYRRNRVQVRGIQAEDRAWVIKTVQRLRLGGHLFALRLGGAAAAKQSREKSHAPKLPIQNSNRCEQLVHR